ncbi:tRNA-modifying protein YgfZ [Buchnera aphidicola (Takecallis taiwana)]|uniref:tRNA-modifying protein YgfZ n=1 Tax=Buchnera aphidicola TaxID=9 RepID=UPI0031B71638
MILLNSRNIIQHVNFFELLTGFSIIKISGMDNQQYLQNHITTDIFKLKSGKHILCGNCNSHGRINSTLRLFHNKHDYFYLQRSSICDIQITELMKYAVFSKVKITKLKNYSFLGVIGPKAKSVLLSHFPYLPNHITSIVFFQDVIILWFDQPILRFLLIVKNKQLQSLTTRLYKNNIANIKNYWFFLDISIGIPIIEKPVFQKFFPQELNLDILGGLDFHKGCYCGQEMISKIHFKNLNNKKLFCLVGTVNSVIDIFSLIEIYIHGNWKKVGCTIFYLKVMSNIFLLQCMLNINRIQSNIFRLASDQTSVLSMLDTHTRI